MSTYDRIIFLSDLQYIYLWTQNSNWKKLLGFRNMYGKSQKILLLQGKTVALGTLEDLWFFVKNPVNPGIKLEQSAMELKYVAQVNQESIPKLRHTYLGLRVKSRHENTDLFIKSNNQSTNLRALIFFPLQLAFCPGIQGIGIFKCMNLVQSHKCSLLIMVPHTCQKKLC